MKDKGNLVGIYGLLRNADIMARTYAEGQFRQQNAGKASWPPAGREILPATGAEMTAWAGETHCVSPARARRCHQDRLHPHQQRPSARLGRSGCWPGALAPDRRKARWAGFQRMIRSFCRLSNSCGCAPFRMWWPGRMRSFRPFRRGWRRHSGRIAAHASLPPRLAAQPLCYDKPARRPSVARYNPFAQSGHFGRSPGFWRDGLAVEGYWQTERFPWPSRQCQLHIVQVGQRWHVVPGRMRFFPE